MNFNHSYLAEELDIIPDTILTYKKIVFTFTTYHQKIEL